MNAPAGDEGSQTIAAYGSWASDLGADVLAAASVRFGQVAVQGRAIAWSEGRPDEGGRNVIVARDVDGRIADLLPAPFDARSRVHEYGGGAFSLGAGGEVFSSHDADQRLYRMLPDEAPRPLTHGEGLRYADAVLDAPRQRLVAVREDHRSGPDVEAVNTLVAVDLASGDETVLVAGHDFYASPRPSPDGRRLAWLCWDHPRMPWDGTELYVAELDDVGDRDGDDVADGAGGGAARGGLRSPRLVAGGAEESIFQPEWSPSGELHFTSDRSGWWNLYRERDGRIEPLQPMAAEFGLPQWSFGMSTYAFAGDGRIVCTFRRDGRARLALLDAERGDWREIDTPFSSIENVRAGDGFAAFVAASPTAVAAVVRLDLQSLDFESVRLSSDLVRDPDDIAVAEPIVVPTAGRETHAFFYAPRNRRHAAPSAERPPLLVISHGGPTAASDASLRLGVQYWTHRGFAVVDVNYGGSSGYGRAYRDRLRGAWGLVDVEDCIAAARFLAGRGDVDPARLAIRGASAGGFTTLAALVFHDFFHAGASHYGVGDLEALARDTHKFESRYLDGLVGPYPERADLYRARSPIHFVERLSSALILLQGAEDRVVPPSQAEAMYGAALAKGLPVAYLLFEGEQHGFRRAATIRRALEAELAFYGRVFGFAPADRIAPLDLKNA